MRRSFIANISHELRSPMTSINGFIEGMLDGTIPEEKSPYYLNIVRNEIKRLIRLINDLLDLARLESGEFSIQMGVFNINELIRERVIKFEDKINKKNIRIDISLPENRVNAKGDRDRIDQVITNLLDNSIKFVPQEGNIKIKTEIKQDRVMVSVYNNGSGIPKEDINYIWDRFHKVDKARVKGGGTGLGLSIARQIINQHNQNIWAESGDEGTKFIFTLALAQNIVKI
jgi:signal transduction histidine kinase